MRYPGGKGKTFAHLINLMPPHRRYIETHLGGGAVLRNKRPAEKNIGIEIDPKVIAQWRSEQYAGFPMTLVHDDALKVLPALALSSDDLVYMDPPYMPTTRSRSKVYRFDYCERDHEQLLAMAILSPAMTMISGYRCDLYDHTLRAWNRFDFEAKTHTGIRSESIWFNYDHPSQLHDTRFIGDNFRERQDARRRADRLRQRVKSLPLIEQASLLQWLSASLGKASHEGSI